MSDTTTTEAPKKKSLYHIREDHASIIAQIEDQDGEITNEQLAALNLNEQDFDNKAISIAYAIRKAMARSEEAKAEIDRLQKIKKSWDALEERLKEYLITGMQDLNHRKIESATLKVSLRSTKSVEIIDANILPAEAVNEKTVITPNKTHIKALIERGDAVPGAQIIEKDSLIIK